MADLITIADVADKKLLNNPDLPNLISDASAAIDTRCNRTFALTSYTETHSGQGLPRLWLRNTPVATVDAITVDGYGLDNTLGDCWTFDPESGELVRGRGRDDRRFAPWFPRGTNNVVVNYTAGFFTLPRDVRRAALILVKHLADGTKATGLFQTERIGDYSYTMGDPDSIEFPPLAAGLLAKWVI